MSPLGVSLSSGMLKGSKPSWLTRHVLIEIQISNIYSMTKSAVSYFQSWRYIPWWMPNYCSSKEGESFFPLTFAKKI